MITKTKQKGRFQQRLGSMNFRNGQEASPIILIQDPLGIEVEIEGSIYQVPMVSLMEAIYNEHLKPKGGENHG